jgi:hypothetical protein
VFFSPTYKDDKVCDEDGVLDQLDQHVHVHLELDNDVLCHMQMLQYFHVRV